jgi:hypothetical protein
MLFFSFSAFSQVNSINVVSNDVDSVDIELGQQKDSNYVDEESSVIEAEGEVAKSLVDLSEDLLSYVNILKDRDSLVYHFCVMKDENNIIPQVDDNTIKLDKKFDIVFHPNTNKVMYVSEMILNENQAWDFIYERIFDENGLLKMFIRHYSTFNSVCAEVAFEISEYFYNEKGDLIKKTYEIFNGDHNPLNINDCWMEREDYVKEKSFNELNAKFNLPLEGLPLSPEKKEEKKDNNNQEEIRTINNEGIDQNEVIQEENKEVINQE